MLSPLTVLLLLEAALIGAAAYAVPRLRRAGEAEWRRHQRAQLWVRVVAHTESIRASLAKIGRATESLTARVAELDRLVVEHRAELGERP